MLRFGNMPTPKLIKHSRTLAHTTQSTRIIEVDQL